MVYLYIIVFYSLLCPLHFVFDRYVLLLNMIFNNNIFCLKAIICIEFDKWIIVTHNSIYHSANYHFENNNMSDLVELLKGY